MDELAPPSKKETERTKKIQKLEFNNQINNYVVFTFGNIKCKMIKSELSKVL